MGSLLHDGGDRHILVSDDSRVSVECRQQCDAASWIRRPVRSSGFDERAESQEAVFPSAPEKDCDAPPRLRRVQPAWRALR
jgi:hypothetical protein